ncbi:MAG: hypothetical protein IJM32_01870 [Ruminococcus sp.]|nr:hypothetical protein [Ruminococcus sp.]
MGRLKREKAFESSVNELGKRNAADILLSVVLLCCAAVLLFLYIKAPAAIADIKSYHAMTLVFPLCDIAIAAAVFFKIGFFRWFTLTAWTAKLKGIERNRVLPTQMYITSVRIFALMFTLVNIIFMILVIRKVV